MTNFSPDDERPPERPAFTWVDSGSGPGMTVPLGTVEDQDAAQIMAEALEGWRTPDDDE